MGQVRTTRPGEGNKYFIRKANGGYSTCIQGKPTDRWCNVLSNCVGYACGAYNEQENLGYEKYHLNCNAENFIERAIASGLSVVQNPVVGGIMVWQKGTLASSDGAGHVAICIYNDGRTIKYAQSGYGSSNPFWITTTTNTNGRYGLSSSYKYRGCIAPKTWKPDSTPVNPEPKPTPGPVGKFNIGDKVVINGPLYPNSNAGSPTGNASNKVTNITRRNDGSAHPYNTTGDLGWMDESSITKYVEPTPTPEPKPEPTPEPTVETFKVGDRVKPTRLVDYNGTPLRQYDDSYTISELKGNRAVLTAPRNGKPVVWAAMRTEDITHV